MINLANPEIWFVCGSQHLYGPGPLQKVAANASEVAAALAKSPKLPLKVVFKPLMTTPDDIAKGRDYRMKLNDAEVIADVEAAAAFLGAKKLGIVGYCFGGTVAWWGATRTTKFAASSCWYGGGIAGTKDERPNCPVQLHFGEKDASIPMSDVEAVRAAQPKVETYVYMGAGHGFGCDERGSFSKPDYDLAQQRTLDFFAKHLG